jgi:ABC-type phosphate/phosphonate transport system substrate-binding protein
VARADDPARALADLAGRRFAYNEAMSQSGWAAPACHMAAAGLAFGPLLATGAHRASALAVAEGRADFAALDALTWALIGDHDHSLAAALRVIDATAPTPGLPLITSATGDPGALFSAVSAAIADLSPADRAVLHLHGLVRLPAAAYLAVPTPPPPGQTLP